MVLGLTSFGRESKFTAGEFMAVKVPCVKVYLYIVSAIIMGELGVENKAR